MTSKLTSEILDDETLAELIAFRRSRVEYCQKEGLPYQKALHDSMMLALEELQERRKVERDTEPYGFTDGDRRGMIYKPEHSDRLSEPVPVYRHPQPAPVVQMVPEEPPEHLLPKGNSRDTTYRRGAIILGWKLCRAAMLSGGKS
ncbi:hypothetical protein L0F50_02565 [Klebsiella pneumoniae]|nr:hypothetical protein [Klebsiella pneumoniae]